MPRCFYSSANFFIFRICSNDQEIYHEFAAKVDNEKTYKAAEKLTRKLYPKCSTDKAWSVKDIAVYEGCTAEISASNAKVKYVLPKIQAITQSNNLTINLQAEVTQLMEDVEFNPYANDGLEVAITYIEKKITRHLPVTCSEVQGCLESTRKIVVLLKMIEWRLLGIGEATAGLYLAYHYSMIGPYFGDVEGKNPNSHHKAKVVIFYSELLKRSKGETIPKTTRSK